MFRYTLKNEGIFEEIPKQNLEHFVKFVVEILEESANFKKNILDSRKKDLKPEP